MLHIKYQGARHCRFRQENLFYVFQHKSKAEGKRQKSKQSSTTTNPRPHM